MTPTPSFFERHRMALLAAGALALLVAPFVAYPIFLMKLMCFALLAASAWSLASL